MKMACIHGYMALKAVFMDTWLPWIRGLFGQNGWKKKSPKWCQRIVGGMASRGHCFLGDMEGKKKSQIWKCRGQSQKCIWCFKIIHFFNSALQIFFRAKKKFPSTAACGTTGPAWAVPLKRPAYLPAMMRGQIHLRHRDWTPRDISGM